MYWHGDFAGARVPYESALGAWREMGDRSEIANALYNLSFSYAMDLQRDEAGARRASELLDEALALYRELGDEHGQATVLWGIGVHLYFGSHNLEASVALEEALPLARRVGDRTLEAWCHHQLGSARLKLGDIDAGAGPPPRRPRAVRRRRRRRRASRSGSTTWPRSRPRRATCRGPRGSRASPAGSRPPRDRRWPGVVDEAFEQATRPNAANGLGAGGARPLPGRGRRARPSRTACATRWDPSRGRT